LQFEYHAANLKMKSLQLKIKNTSVGFADFCTAICFLNFCIESFFLVLFAMLDSNGLVDFSTFNNPALGKGLLSDFFQAVVFGPILETYLVVVCIKQVEKLVINRWAISLVVAAVFGALHGLIHWTSIFSAAVGFFIYSAAFLAWRPHSYDRAFFAALIPHGFNNLVAVFLIHTDLF
jgi:hypothetical protein